jgi:hypothetical protein
MKKLNSVSPPLNQKGNTPVKLTINEVMDEVLPLLVQKYVVPKFDGITDVTYTIGKVPRRRKK